MMMAIGAMLGLLGMPLPGVELGIAMSAVLLGSAILADWKVDMTIATLLVGIFAVFHGHAHGTELPEGQSGLLYSMGFVAGTGLLHAVGILLGFIERFPRGRLVIRSSGILIALLGCYFMVQAV